MPIISPKIPSGLEELMRGLAKSVIKENPQNIYEFAAEYFENLLKERDGSCDQSYKKFATYKVYKKNKNARLKRERENSNDVNDGFRRDVSFKRDSSVEEIILPPVATQQSLHSLPKTSISSDSTVVNDTVKQRDEGASTTEDDDIKNMVLDDDMEKAALKIQSSFRGHKVRREIKETKEEDEQVKEASEPEGEPMKQSQSESDVNESRELVEGSIDGSRNDENVKNEQEIAVDDTKTPLESEVDDDIANMVLDDDMEQAALKIQASFRGHKVRRDMKETDGPKKSLAEDCAIAKDDEEVIEESGADENEVVEVENIEERPELLNNESVKSENLSVEQSVQDEEIAQVTEETEKDKDSNELVEVNEETVVKETSKESLSEPENNEQLAEAEAENVENEATAIDEDKLAEEIVEIGEAVGSELVSVVEQEVESVLEEAVERIDGQDEAVLEGVTESVVDETESVVEETVDGEESGALEGEVEIGQDVEVVAKIGEEAGDVGGSVEQELAEKTIDRKSNEIVEPEVVEPQIDEVVATETDEVAATETDEIVATEIEADAAQNDEQVVEPAELEADDVGASEITTEETKVASTETAASFEGKSEDVATDAVELQAEEKITKSLEQEVNVIEGSIDHKGTEEVVEEEPSNVDESLALAEENATETAVAADERDNDNEKVGIEEETPLAEGETLPLEGLDESSSSVENATDEVDKVEDVPAGNNENSTTAAQEENLETDEQENNEDEIIPSEVISETQQKAEEIEQDSPEGEDLSPQPKSASIENDEAEKLEEEASVADENSGNLAECENVIESNDNVASEAGNESESLEEKLQETSEAEETVESNEREPQEGLSALPMENEDSEAVEVDYTDAVPVVEEICEQKFIEQLKPDQEIVESEIDGNVLGRDSLNQIEGDQENLEESLADDVNDNQEKLPTGEIEYSKLKESMSEHGSIDEADNKSRELTDEKSIDGDSVASRQLSLDDVQDEAIEQAEGKESSSTVDEIGMNETQQAEPLDLHLNEPTENVESILHADISPIELMDEVVNEFAGAVASELFSGGVEHLDEQSNLKISGESAIEENQSTERVEPKLSVEKPLEQIEQQRSIDLAQESVQLSGDLIEPIIDEILQPEPEESEIPEESQAPVDESIPTVSMEEKSPSLEKDEPEHETEENSDPQPKPEEDDVSDMVLDEEMEDAALKIQAAFRGHKVRKEKVVENAEENVDEKSESVEANVVVDQCSEQTQEQEETEQQDTSADVEEIQESEAVDEEETNEERQDEEENAEEETAVEEETETAEDVEDDPEGAPEEGETSEQQQANNEDDDDVANMVLDEEMENAALKIQATFRGHKTRKDIKKDEPEGETSTADEPQETKDLVQEVDDDIANMVLDEEMENAALKIQASFRGQRNKKEIKKEDDGDDEKKEEDEAEEKKEEEPEPTKEEEAPASSSTDKTAKQLQDEEDIANIVMDAEMEQTAKKIQSVFRRKKKGSNDSTESSAGDQSDEGEDDEVDEDPFKPGESQEQEETADRYYDDEKGSEHSTARYSSLDDGKYSLERESSDNEPMPLNTTIEDLNLMQGGGIFPEPSAESSEMLTGSSGEDRDPDRHSSYQKVPSAYSNESDEPISQEKAEEPLDDEQVIENFDFVANKDTAEAMYYSLKKNEIESQKRLSSEKQLSTERQPETDDDLATSMEAMTNLENQSLDEDDDDVVIGRTHQSTAKRLKYGMSMDDRLLGSILSKDYSKVRRDGGYPDDGFDPLLEATMRNHNFLEKLHETSTSEDDKSPAYDDYPGDDEDQFDNFYDSKSIREKIMASSFSIADSDYFDPTHNKSIIDDDKIRTALETIHSTDSESTIASAATRIQVGERAGGKRNNITTHSMQYSSIGNAAIDRSLDDFIQSQELRIERFDEEAEGYMSPSLRKQESVDEWTDDTTTYTDSDKKVAGAGGVIEIKLEQKTSFLTVDERRRTLHREDAVQRNSTREDEDSSKSSNVSGEKLLEKESGTVETVVASVTSQDSVIDTEIAVPVLDLTARPKATSQTPAKPQRMKRQHTMPVQIQTDVIRVVPKHLRKRIKSADGDKKKRGSK